MLLQHTELPHIGVNSSVEVLATGVTAVAEDLEGFSELVGIIRG